MYYPIEGGIEPCTAAAVKLQLDIVTPVEGVTVLDCRVAVDNVDSVRLDHLDDLVNVYLDLSQLYVSQ